MKENIQKTISTGIVELDFKFLGYRDYVHGSSMLDGLLKSMKKFVDGDAIVTATIKSFKIIREFDTFAVAESMYSRDCHYHPRLKEATARLDMDCGDEKYTALLLPIEEKPVFNRIESYDAADFVERIGIDGNGVPFGVIQHNNDLIDFLRGVVEANRQITLQEDEGLSNVEKIRWGYIADFKMISEKEFERIKEVRFISKKVLPALDRYFIVKRVHIDGSSQDYDFDICFYVKKKLIL